MSENAKPDYKNQHENQYCQFFLHEFKDTYTIAGLCEAIRTDGYGIKFVKSSDNSIGRLNELLECTSFFAAITKNKQGIRWSLDVEHLIRSISNSISVIAEYESLNPATQMDLKRLNRLLIEEAYPKQTPKSCQYFIPPGLMDSVQTFEDHYKVAESEPILIVGPTGVGKSLFLHIFEKLYREEHDDEKKYPIIKANCAHFGGDPNLVRSELFGHMEGAFTGAIYEKSGLVAMADGGVLILEEIGDLPPETQAALLTFIETGEYYRVGDDRKKSKKKGEEITQDKEHRGPRKANVQIVGLTNREENLRDDFNHRFFPFYIPPIHQRREDILYYFHALFPDLFDSMKPYEILTLLTYNWPGNVREIERHGRLMRRTREGMKRMTFRSESERSSFDAVKLYNLDPNSPHVTIEAYHVFELYHNLMGSNVDVELLENVLNKYQVGLKESRDIKDSFIVGNYSILSEDISERYGLRFTYHIESFNKAYQGLRAFAELFYQDPMANVNLLDLKDSFVFGDPFDELIEYPKAEINRFQQMIKSIFEYLSGIKLLESDIIADNIFERDNLFTMLGKANQGNHFLATLGFTELRHEKDFIDFDICSFKIDDLLKLYYHKLLDRAGGNQKIAAKLAGIPYTTFREALIRYRIEAGRKAKQTTHLTN